jgi:RNA polymerase sigma-70 factor (ECF subfamily)
MMNASRSMLETSRAIAEEDFLRLLEPLLGRLSRYCRAVAVDQDDAKDLASETILLAFQSFSKLRETTSFASYLFSIATRLHRRQHSRQKKFDRFDIAVHDRAAQSSPETAIDVEILYRALKKLPSKQQEAIILFEISGLSLEEVRVIQGGSLSGVKTRLARGRETLQRLMGVERDTASRRETPEKQSRTSPSSLAYSIDAKL